MEIYIMQYYGDWCVILCTFTVFYHSVRLCTAKSRKMSIALTQLSQAPLPDQYFRRIFIG